MGSLIWCSPQVLPGNEVKDNLGLSLHLVKSFLGENLRCVMMDCTRLWWLPVVLLGHMLALGSCNTECCIHMACVSCLSPKDSFLSQAAKGKWRKVSALCSLSLLAPLREIPTGQLIWFVAPASLAPSCRRKQFWCWLCWD